MGMCKSLLHFDGPSFNRWRIGQTLLESHLVIYHGAETSEWILPKGLSSGTHIKWRLTTPFSEVGVA